MPDLEEIAGPPGAGPATGQSGPLEASPQLRALKFDHYRSEWSRFSLIV
jgi:hypothetical protein